MGLGLLFAILCFVAAGAESNCVAKVADNIATVTFDLTKVKPGPETTGTETPSCDCGPLKTKIRSFEQTINRQGRMIDDIYRRVGGWTKIGSYYIWISDKAADWHSAERQCKEKGSRLASGVLKSTASREGLYNRVRATKLDYWIGLSDIKTEGIYRWSDGGTLPINSSLWASHEPRGGRGKNCIQIWFKEFGLDDATCSGHVRFICEMDA